MGNWQKIVTKMIGDDVGGNFASNIGIATMSEDFVNTVHDYDDQAQLDAFWVPLGVNPLTIRANFATKVIDWDFRRSADNPVGQKSVAFNLFLFGKFDSPFGSLPSDGNWALRWQMNFGSGLTAPSTVDSHGTVGLFDNFSTLSDGVQSFIAFQFLMNIGGDQDIRLVSGNASTVDSPTTVATFNKQFSSDETLYFELKRTSPTTIEGTIYSDADYKVIIEKIKVTGIASAIIDLEWVRVMNQDNNLKQGVFNGTADEFEVFNESEGQQNFFTAKGNDKASTYDVFPDLITGQNTSDWVADLFDGASGWVDAGISEIRQVALQGVIECLVDADGGNDGVAIDLNNQILETPDFEDNFSTDTWTQVGSNVFISGGVMNANNPASTSFDDLENKDMLGVTISDTMWVLRWKYTATTITQGTNTNDQDVFVLISDETSTSGATNPQRHIGFRHRIDSGINVFELIQQNVGAPTNPSQDTANFTPVQGTTYFMELIRTSATTCELNIYSDAGFSTLLDTLLATPNIGLINLRFAKVMSFSNGGNDGTLNTEVDDVKFWDGVTTPFIDNVSDSAWVLRGSFNINNFNGANSFDKTLFIGLFSANQVLPPTVAQDGIFFCINTNSDFSANKTGDAWIGHSDGTFPQNATEVPFTYDYFNPMLEGRFFFELKRTCTTTVECTLFDHRGFEFPLETIFQTIPATVVDLRYVKLTARIGGALGRITMYFDTFEFWNGETNSCIFNTTPVLEQDTAQARLNYCNSNIFYSGIDDNTNDSISIDLGSTLSDSAFVMRCAIDVVDNNVAVSSTPFHWIGLTSSNSVANGSVSQEGIALRADPTTGNYNASHGFGTDPQSGWTNETDYTGLTITNGRFYLEIARLSNIRARMSLFSDEDFNDLIDSRTFAIDAQVNDLRFFKIMNRQVAATTAFWEIIVTNIQVWDATNVVDGFAELTLLEIMTTGNQVSGVQNGHYHFNSDAQTGNYKRRNEQNNGGGTGSQSLVETFFNNSVTNFSQSFMSYLKVNNQKAFPKYAWGEKTWNGGVGVALPPNRVESVGEWDINTERLNKIHVFNQPGNGDFDTDSNLIVFGTDGTVDPDGFLVESGTFTKVTSPTTMQSVFLGFQPKAIIFTGYHDDLGDADVSADANGFFGFIDDANNQKSIGWGNTNAVALTESINALFANRAIIFVRGFPSPTFFGQDSRAIVTITPTGFDCDWDIQDSVASRVHFIAFGGSDITGVQCGDQNKLSTAVPATQSIVTDADCQNGVEGEAVAFLCYNRTAVGFGLHNNACIGIGTKGPPSLENGMIEHLNDFGGTSQARQDFRESEFNRNFDTAAQMLDDQATFGGFDAAGFDIDWGPVTSTQGPRIIWLIIKGGKWQSGNETARTTVGNRATLTNFKPKGLLTLSVLRTAEGNDLVREDRNPNVGFTDGTNQSASAMTDEDAVSPTNLGVMGATAHIVRYHSSVNQALLVESNIVAFNDTNFTLDWTTVDGNAYKFYWLVCG